MKGISPQKQTAEWLKNIPPPPDMDAIVISDEEDPGYQRVVPHTEGSRDREASEGKKQNEPTKEAGTATNVKDNRKLTPKLDVPTLREKLSEVKIQAAKPDITAASEKDEEKAPAEVHPVVEPRPIQTSFPEDNDSDLDSLGEQKLAKPMTSASTKMSIKLKTNFQGNIKDKGRWKKMVLL